MNNIMAVLHIARLYIDIASGSSHLAALLLDKCRISKKITIESSRETRRIRRAEEA